jgi:hypothetical protein
MRAFSSPNGWAQLFRPAEKAGNPYKSKGFGVIPVAL